MRADLVMLLTCLAVVDWQVDHPPARCMNMLGLLQPNGGQMYDKTFISDWIAVRPTV